MSSRRDLDVPAQEKQIQEFTPLPSLCQDACRQLWASGDVYALHLAVGFTWPCDHNLRRLEIPEKVLKLTRGISGAEILPVVVAKADHDFASPPGARFNLTAPCEHLDAQRGQLWVEFPRLWP